MSETLAAFADRASAAIIWAADGIFGPYALMPLLFGVGLFLTLRLRFVQVTRFREAARTIAPGRPGGRQGPALALPGVHDGAGRLDRHRQHRGRRHRDRGRGTGRALLDLGLRLLRDRHQVPRGGARHPLPRAGGRAPLRRARCTTCATASAAPRWPGSTRSSPAIARAHHHAHVRSPTRSRVALEDRRSAIPTLGHGRRARGPDLARDHRRHQVDRARGREARAG